jgi:hypothetical protein
MKSEYFAEVPLEELASSENELANESSLDERVREIDPDLVEEEEVLERTSNRERRGSVAAQKRKVRLVGTLVLTSLLALGAGIARSTFSEAEPDGEKDVPTRKDNPIEKEKQFREMSANGVMSSIEVFKEEPYAWELIEKAVHSKPEFGLGYYESYSSFPEARALLEESAHTVRDKDPYRLLTYIDVLGNLSDHEDLIRGAVTAADKHDGSMLLKYGNKLADRPYAIEAIKRAVAREPSLALMMADSFDKVPGAQSWIEDAVHALRSQHRYHDLIEDADRFQFMTDASTILEEAAGQVPRAAVMYDRKYKNFPNASLVLEHAVRQIAAEEPDWILGEAEHFVDEPYAGAIIREAAQKDPREALTNARFFEKLPDAQEIGYDAALAIVEKDFGTVLVCSKAFVGYPEKGPALLLHAAELTVEKDPARALDNASHFRQLPQYSEMARRAADACMKRDPGKLLSAAQELPAEQWVDDFIAAAAVKAPERAVQYFNQYQERKNAMEIVLRALPIVAETDPIAVLDLFSRNSQNARLTGDPDLLRLLEQSVLADPDRSLDRLDHIQPLLQKISNPAIDKLREVDAFYKKRDVTKTLSFGSTALLQDVVDGKITIEQANDIGNDPNAFFTALVSINRQPHHLGAVSVDRQLRTVALRTVYEINARHEESDRTRFKSVENATLDELYVYMVYGEEEIFTSSFNGLFTRLLARMEEDHLSGHDLIEHVGYNKFRTFIKLAANFNRLNEFLDTMQPEDRQALLDRFVRGLDGERDMLGQAVTTADTFSMLTDATVLRAVQEATKSEYDRVQNAHEAEATRIYGLLASMFENKAVVEESWINEMAERYKLANVMEVPASRLFNEQGMNVQRYYFYNDDDGKSSFSRLLSQYRSSAGWKVEDAGSYITISSVEGSHIVLYANKPSDEKGNGAVDALFEQGHLAPSVVVHRGHSYHLGDTVSQLKPSAKIIYLGSCGGYRSISNILDIAPEASVVSTKGTGNIDVNEPLLKMLNDRIRVDQHVEWQSLWDEAEKRLHNNPNFKNYVAPHRNLGILFLKAYRSTAN